MTKFVPLEKQSKKQRRAFHAARRRGWNGLDPVTRRPPEPRAFRRKKFRYGKDDPDAGTFLFAFFRQS